MFEIVVEIVLPSVATGVGGYLTIILRRLDSRLDQQDKHETALFGDADLGWPGVVELASENREALASDGLLEDAPNERPSD